MSNDFGNEVQLEKNPKIESCPTCGEDYQYIKCSPGLSAKRYSVHCRKCGTHTKYRFATEIEAIKVWNWRRHNE